MHQRQPVVFGAALAALLVAAITPLPAFAQGSRSNSLVYGTGPAIKNPYLGLASRSCTVRKCSSGRVVICAGRKIGHRGCRQSGACRPTRERCYH